MIDIRSARVAAYEHSRSLRDPYTPTPCARVTAFKFAATCPDCGGELEPTARGNPELRRVTAMVHCTGCDLDAQVLVQLDVTHRPKYYRKAKP